MLLKNGSDVPEPIVITTMIALKSLSGVELYEAVELARNPAHKLWGSVGETLAALALADELGVLYDPVRDVLASAADGDGLGLRLVSPVKVD